MATAATPTPITTEREEMWYITLAKSKIMRFFSVSCELVIFFGCLWLTLVTILPGAEKWLDGGVNSFFLVVMGFAVDAAMPESWLHVVEQHLEKRATQFKWSIAIAIAMLILVICNIVYTKVVGETGKTPDGAMGIIVNSLLIARMFIGICYVTIRGCQDFLTRKEQPTAPAATITLMPEETIDRIIERVTESVTKKIEATLDTKVQALAPVAPEPEPLDYSRILKAVRSYLAASGETTIEEIPGTGARANRKQAQLLAPGRAQRHTAKPGPAATRLSREERLENAYSDLIEQGITPSGRNLSEIAHCNRAIATDWLEAKLQKAKEAGTKAGTNAPDEPIAGEYTEMPEPESEPEVADEN